MGVRAFNLLSLSLFLSVLFSMTAPFAQAVNLYQDALQYQQQGEPKAAIIQLKNLLREEPDNSQARLLLGTLYLQTGQYQGAEKELNRAKQLDSKDPGLALMLIRSRFGQGHYAEVVEQLLALSVTDKVASSERDLLLGHSYSALGQFAEAEAAYRQAQTQQPSTRISLSLARLALLQQTPAIALTRLEEAELDPSGAAEATMIRGQAYLQQRRTDAAKQAFDQVLALNPAQPLALLGRVKALLLEGDTDAARVSLDQLLSLAPRFPDALLISAVLHLKAGKPQQAKDILDPLSQMLGEQAEVLHLTGYANLLLGHDAQAAQQLSRNLTNHPEHAPSRLALTQLHLKQSQFTQAQQTLAPLLDADVVSAEALALAGTLSLRQGDAVAASEYFQQALAQSERTELARPLALSELLSGDLEAGISRLEGLTAEDANPQTDALLLRAYLSAQRLDSARTLLQRRIQSFPEDSVYRLMAAALELQLQQPAAATQHLQAVLAKDKASIPALLGMAYLSLQQQAPRDAEEWYRQAQEADPDDIRALQGQVSLALSEGRSKTAEQQAASFYRQHRNAKDAAQLYLSVLQRLGDRVQLQQLLKTVIEDQPDEPSFKLQQADLSFSQGEPAIASIQLDQLLIRHPDYIPAQLARIKLRLAQQQPQQALDLSRALPAQAQGHPSVALLRGQAFEALKQTPAAIDEYLKAYQARPVSDATLRLARIYAVSKGEAEAIAFLKPHLERHPDDVAALSLLAGLLQQRDDSLEAISAYERVTEQQPTHMVAWNNLAWLYQSQGDSRALVAAEQAHKLAPKIAAVTDTLGWILLASDPQRALGLLNEAAQQLPEDYSVQYHYAAALAKNARTQEAVTRLRSLKERSFAEKEAAMALLKTL
tara:strand:+ start:1521 stop:4172 length:2652 start_codon:yes stop_codon:yes gene_type:complete